MDQWNFIADRKIREAMDDGKFDNLEGMGEPLDLTENPFEPPALRMAHRLLRNNGFAPSWIEESKDIDAEIRRVQTRPDPAAIEAVNRRILAFNLKAPALCVHKRPVHISG